MGQRLVGVRKGLVGRTTDTNGTSLDDMDTAEQDTSVALLAGPKRCDSAWGGHWGDKLHALPGCQGLVEPESLEAKL